VTHPRTASPATETLPGLDAKVQFLRNPAAHEGHVTEVLSIETHMSWVFLAGDHVLKLKKPVRLPHLDFSTVQAREFDCREEVRLNARLAPGVYLGLRALQWHQGRCALLPPEALPAPGHTVDWLVLMRRLPEARMLHQLAMQGRVQEAEVDELLAQLGPFYRDASRANVTADEMLARLRREQAATRDVLLRPQFSVSDAAHALDGMDCALSRHAGLLAGRCTHGHIVDGHGDLRPEHVCLIRPPVVIDCLEFNAQLRQVDPVDELAFLGLECAMVGAPWIGPRLLDGLARYLGDRPAPELVALYTAQRAMLRARLCLAHLLDPTPRTPEKWLPLAQQYVHRALAALHTL
jgi:aminoglycoside phosphotransferase family enzyme